MWEGGGYKRPPELEVFVEYLKNDVNDLHLTLKF